MKLFNNLLFGLVLFSTCHVVTQDTYQMLPHTPVLSIGEYVQLPKDIYIHQNTVSRVFYFQDAAFVVEPNVRVYPNTHRQTETIIVRHPLNQNIMWGSANVQAPGISEGLYLTTNNGVNWFGSDTILGLPMASHGGDPGIVIDKDGRLLFTHIGGGTVPGMAANFSTDMGATWTDSYQIESGNVLQHEPSMSTDDAPWSPFYGRSYVTYTNVAGVRKVQFSLTSNGGVNWSLPLTISPVSASNHYQAWSDIPSRTGPGGEIYVIWNNYIGASQPDSIGFAKSTNGGINWDLSTNNAFNINGLPTGNTINGMRYFHFPRVDVDRSGSQRNGWIYIVTNEMTVAPATDLADVILYRSTDGGVTWSTGIRVNQDTPGNGKYQLFPAIRVDEASNINVVYYDSRNTPTNDSLEVFVSRSGDGGNTWVDILASDHKSRPKSAYQGDYIGITSGNGAVWPLWMDDFTGVQQAWTVKIGILTGIVEGSSIPEDYSLEQNYPNPFNPETKIKFSIKKEGFVRLVIYDILGKEVSELIAAELLPKSYELNWNAVGSPSGIYFCKLIAGDYSETRRMVLVK
jgi:Secretion system C-terminal sorting domain